jgi:hypothetical protein
MSISVLFEKETYTQQRQRFKCRGARKEKEYVHKKKERRRNNIVSTGPAHLITKKASI